MLLYENKKAKLINILRIGINPFKKFVATGEIKEEIGLVPSRQEFMSSVINTIKNKNENFILPIIGEVGTGKTHLYWALKNRLYYHNTCYISLENVYRKFYYNLYSEYIEEMGLKVLRSITTKLCIEWGALEKKFGFFNVVEIKKIRDTALKGWSNKFEDNLALRDIINAITAHQLDPYEKIDAERWLLGELFNVRELSHLGLSHDLRRKNHAFSMLKIIIENSKLGTVLFIDDFEKIISLLKPEKKEEEIFDSSWLYGNGKSSPESIAAQKTLDKILKLLEIKGLKIIVTLKSVEALQEIEKMVKEKNEKLLIAFEKPLFLSNFIENDIYRFYKKIFKEFLKSIGYLEFNSEFEKSYFPINEKILKLTYDFSKGNPREIIKYLIKIFNDIIYSDENLENIISRYENSK